MAREVGPVGKGQVDVGETFSSLSLCGGRGGRVGDRGATRQGGCSGGHFWETTVTRPSGREMEAGARPAKDDGGRTLKGLWAELRELLWGSRRELWGSILQGP